jgi:tryptophan synthase alpha chain
MNIKEVFKNLKNENKKGFIPYITAGDKNLDWTQSIVKTFHNSGASIVELGVPFSDPMADGPTNQLASERALANGVNLTNIFSAIKELREEEINIPIILFSYYNPIYKFGLQEFSKECSRNGIQGSLILDLPPEEGDDYIKHMKAEKLDTIFLASPTTTPERIKYIDSKSTGFIYYVARTGVTGESSQISQNLKKEAEAVRSLINNPLAIGFGISDANQAKEVANNCDAIVIGSTIVNKIANAKDLETAQNQIKVFSEEIVEKINET